MKREEIEKTKKEKNLMSQEEFSKLINKSITTVKNWINEGIIVTEYISNTRYVVPGKTLLNLYQYYEKKANDKENKKDREQLQNEKLQADINYKNTATELQQYKRDIQTGKYIDTAKVKEANAKFLSMFKNFALSMPGQLIGMVAHKLDKQIIRETQANLEEQVRKLLTNFVESGRLEEEQFESGKIELNRDGEEVKKRGRKKK